MRRIRSEVLVTLLLKYGVAMIVRRGIETNRKGDNLCRYTTKPKFRIDSAFMHVPRKL